MRHSGGESLLWTSATVTLYLEVEDSRLRRPGVEQKMSVGRQAERWDPSLVLGSLARIDVKIPSSSSWDSCTYREMRIRLRE